MSLASDEKATEVITKSLQPVSVSMHSPISALQIRIVPSSEADAISFASGEKATDLTDEV